MAVSLCRQPRNSCADLLKLLGDDLETGMHLSVVEADENVAFPYVHSVRHRNVRDNTASWMLNFFDARFGDDCAGNNHRSRERRKGGPAATDDERYGEHPATRLALVFERTRQIGLQSAAVCFVDRIAIVRIENTAISTFQHGDGLGCGPRDGLSCLRMKCWNSGKFGARSGTFADNHRNTVVFFTRIYIYNFLVSCALFRTRATVQNGYVIVS